MKRRCFVFAALTLAAVTLCGVESATTPLPTLWIIGDSTVRNGTAGNGAGGLWGWGSLIGSAFDLKKIRIENRALGGTSSRSFQATGRWNKILADVKPGDFVIMQFGHNDGGNPRDDTARGRPSLKGTGEETQEVTMGSGEKEVVHTFGWYMRKYISDTKAKGATPIVCSLIPRNDWTGDKVPRADRSYGKWARESAEAGSAFFIDLNNIIAGRYEQIGREKVTREFFVSEHTHTSRAGAALNAECVLEGLKMLKECRLNDYVLTGSARKPIE
jgi:lysophospholipase L1-like esterase